MDLGANGLQTFRYVLLPELRSALVAGALLAFALSWDEVIVTIFTAGGNTTIPIWIWTGLRTGGSGSEINVVAAVVVVLSIVPVYFAQRLTSGVDARAEPRPDVAPDCRRRGRHAAVLMSARPARWALARRGARLPGATACGTSGSTANAPVAGPSGAGHDAAARRGRAAAARAPGLCREQPGSSRSSAAPAAASRCATPTAPRDLRSGAADGWAFDVASIPGGPRLRRRPGRRRAGAQPRARPAARASFRAPFRDPAAGRAGARRYGVSFMWTPRLLIWRHSIRKHAPATWAPLSWNVKARRGRVALEDTPLEIGDAAIALRTLAPQLAITDPYALDETQFAAARGADEAAPPPRRRALAAARRRDRRLRRRARRRRRRRLVHGRGRSATRTSTSASRCRARARPARSTSGCSAPTRLHPGCAYRWMRYASERRVQAQVARFYGATPVNAGACGRARHDDLRTRCTPTRRPRS